MTIKGQQIKDYSKLDVFGDAEMFWEIRYDYDAEANLIYQGWNRQANAATSEETWFIVKFHYEEIATEDYVSRKEMPSDGIQFKYAWDDRATIFSA